MTNFDIEATDGRARAGRLKTAHGDIHTPSFITVGTQATVKGLTPRDLIDVGTQVVLGNTYHLEMRPGSEVVKNLGGLHSFMGIGDTPTFTDSGGFQVFSLGEGGPLNLEKGSKSLVTVIDEGVLFKSYIDGSSHVFTPERSIDIQNNLGSDVGLVLDQLPPPECPLDYLNQAMERTHDWGIRGLLHKKATIGDSINPKSLLFGIVQGVPDERIRTKEAKWVDRQDFDGVSIGGSCGDSRGYWVPELIYQTMDWVTPHLKPEWARHALGIGEPVDLLVCSIKYGVDLFDCVSAPRNARRGILYLRPESGGEWKKNFKTLLKPETYASKKGPIDLHCECPICQRYSRAYIYHLSKDDITLYNRLSTIHNLIFVNSLMKEIRTSIQEKATDRLFMKWLGE